MKAKRVELPHPEIQELADLVRKHVVSNRGVTVADTNVTYWVFPAGLTEELGFYDEGGSIYISQTLVDVSEQHADLVAFHEAREIRHKLDGAEHGEAHALAWADELIAAKTMLGISAFAAYLGWRVRLYPEGKGIDVTRCQSRLSAIMEANNTDREMIRAVIHEERL